MDTVLSAHQDRLLLRPLVTCVYAHKVCYLLEVLTECMVDNGGLESCSALSYSLSISLSLTLSLSLSLGTSLEMSWVSVACSVGSQMCVRVCALCISQADGIRFRKLVVTGTKPPVPTSGPKSHQFTWGHHVKSFWCVYKRYQPFRWDHNNGLHFNILHLPLCHLPKTEVGCYHLAEWGGDKCSGLLVYDLFNGALQLFFMFPLQNSSKRTCQVARWEGSLSLIFTSLRRHLSMDEAE